MVSFDLPVDCSLQSARALHGKLAAVLSGKDDVVIDCSAAASIDLSGVQLLVSATRTALAAGATLRLQAVPDTVRLACERAGVAFGPSADTLLIGEV